ncbi:MAG: TIGR02281 family clan AA aspartic protease [Candidatus Scalindua sp.]|nr:TIGR02281 family clan AA aspartic protease [Candidatus Scalindua sp.]
METGKYRTSIAALLVLLVCMSIVSNVYSATRINYRGMDGGKAMISINGSYIKLTPGQTSKDGVKLLSANLREIVVLIDGKRYLYKRDNIHGTILPGPEGITLNRDARSGGYWANGMINGKDVTFLVDTGASLVVMNKIQAKNFKIKRGNKEIEVSTATKTETAYLVTLDSVSIGGIELKNIPACITKHEYPNYPLLGMSFLKHLQINQEKDQMTLEYTAR